MAVTIQDWFNRIKLGIWGQGHISDVGYAKKVLFQNPSSEVHIDNDLGIRLSNYLTLLSYQQVAGGNNATYELCFAIKNYYTGLWRLENYCLYTEGKGLWLNNKNKSKETSSLFQMSKDSPFELKERANFTVRGRELPKPRGFKK